MVYKREVSNGVGNNQLLAGATFRIQGYYPGNPAIPIDRVATTGADGRVVFSDLPAGHFTITEIQPPTGYLLGENNVWTVNIGWGQTVAAGTANSHTFFNIPKSSLEILKVCGVTNEPLAGAIFELYDPTTGERWQATSGANGIALFGRGNHGNFLYPDRTYIIREIVAPPGFVLQGGPREIVLSPGDENRITWRNWRNPGLTVIKQCQDTGERLAGAHFTIEAQGSGRPLPTDFPLITDSNGEIHIPWTLFEGENERNFIVTETVPPPGFNLANPNWQLVTMQAGYENAVVFANRRMPTLTIQKIDARTGYPVQGAWFDVEFLGATAGTGTSNIGPTGPLTNNPFITDSQGRIVIEGLYSGRYRIREIRAANNYWLTPLEADRTWIIEIRDNEDYTLAVENTLLPTLVITKRNAVTWRPIPMTQFRVEYEVPNSPNVQHVGYFMTNAQGQIILPFVPSGWYRVTETRPALGMTLATNNSFRVFLRPGDNSYALIREGVIASQSMVTPRVVEPPAIVGNDPAVEGDEGRTEEMPPANSTVPNAPTPEIPAGTETEEVAPDVDAIVDERLAPEQVNTTNTNSIPNIDPDAIDWDNVEIVHVPDPELVERLNSQMEVWGGDQFWNNELDIWNFPQSSLVIRKESGVTGQLLQGARFSVTRISSGNDSGLAGTIIGEFTTNHSGVIVISGLDPGYYVVTETIPPANYTLSLNNRQHAFLRPDDTSVVELTFTNMPFGALVISKRCEVTGTPLQGAEFRVTNSAGAVIGTANGLFTTNAQGEIVIPNLPPGSYVVTETRAPQGFVLNSAPQTIFIGATGQSYRLEFTNRPEGTLIIRKLDGFDDTPLAGAVFQVRRQNGTLIGEYETDATGNIQITGLLGWVVVEEILAPPGHELDPVAIRTVEIQPGQPTIVTFRNPRLGSITINKEDGDGAPLAGARFRVTLQNGAAIGEFTTAASGMVNVPNLQSGWYIIEEVQAPQGFVMERGNQLVEVRANAAQTVTFVNHRIPTLVIEKVDNNGAPLSGAEFEVRTLAGALVTRLTSNSGGIATTTVEPGSYVVTEVHAPRGFVLDSNAQPFEARPGETTTLRFVNTPYAETSIRKISGDDGRPLQGVVFEITRLNGERVQNPANRTFEFVTDAAGMIHIPGLAAGTYVATETRPLPGYKPADPTTFEVVDGRNTVVTIRNYKMPSVVIRKIDGDTGQALTGVEFEFARYLQNGRTGQRLKNYALDNSYAFTTDSSGHIYLPTLEDGQWAAIETRPLPGYMAAEMTIFTVGINGDTTVIIRNFRYPDFAILKLDGDTLRPLQGVHFEIAHDLGNGQAGQRLVNPADGTTTFVTDAAGRIHLPSIAQGRYIAIETRALSGYTVADPTVFTVGAGENRVITIHNYRQAELTIQKINSNNRAPLEGVHFEISRPDGTRLINPQTGFHTFITDSRGLIHLPSITDGRYYLHETRALPGFIVDQEVIPFSIDASARQREHVLVVENTPAAGLLIVKIDAQTRRPLAGVEFEVRHADGRLVTGQMLDGNQPGTPANSPQIGANGNFITDSNGRINLNHLAPGVYHVTETRALPGYQLDTTVHVVTVIAGQQTVLEVENSPLAGLRLLKVCSVTGEGLFNVEFMVFDSNGKVVGVFYTDNNGVIDFSAILAPGRYTIRETRPAPGFARDDVPRTVEFVAGVVTEIIWENVPIAGQLHILKVSGDDNQHNGLPAGTPLAGAIFEIYCARTGNLVDRIASNERGMAISRPLPLGRYIAREVAAPAFYMINPQEIYFILEHESQIIRVTFPNFSANMGVTIRKTGPSEAMQGHNIFYEIPIVRNDSSIPLADFFWRDILPTNAARVDRLITGTYNHALRYRVLATTNRGNEIVVADNLSTLTNNVVELRPVHLGLAVNEYVVDITLFFGQVPAGFTSVERPRIFVDVLPESHSLLPNGMMFANKVDVGGRVPGSDEWVIGNSTTATTIFNPRRMPQSGW